jgi:small neutral amino acid transporter SnatA (MarC family)
LLAPDHEFEDAVRVSNFDLTPFNGLIRDATRARRSVLWVALIFGAALIMLGLWDLSIGWPLVLGGLTLFAVGVGGIVRRIRRSRQNVWISKRAHQRG